MKINHITYCTNQSNYDNILEHLKEVDSSFIPKLSSTISLNDYSEKLYKFSERFECWNFNKLIGLIAVYFNYQETPFTYITNVSVCKEYMGCGVAKKLMKSVFCASKNRNITRIDLHVNKSNKKAIAFYEKQHFKIKSEFEDSILMIASFK